MSQDPFGDIPLFREIHRLLASGGGPINMEIARQVAAATSLQEGTDAPVRAEQDRVLADAVRESEVLLAGYSRLSFAEPVATTVITRSEWITGTLEGWKWLLEHLAERFTAELGDVGAEEGEQPAAQMMTQIGPLLLGLQTGGLIGSLATEVLATYDPPIPRDGSVEAFLVGGNVQKFASDFGLDEGTVIKWLALNEVARSLTDRSVTWVERYRRNLLITLVDSIEIDTGELERRLVDLQTSGVEALTAGSPFDRSIPVVETHAHRAALDRLRAFMALYEGYAMHIADEVKGELLDDALRVEESMRRYNASPSEGKAMLASVLGFSTDRELESAGRTFCEAVVKLEGIASLNRVWEAPDNLPTYDEIRDPFQWIERVLKAD